MLQFASRWKCYFKRDILGWFWMELDHLFPVRQSARKLHVPHNLVWVLFLNFLPHRDFFAPLAAHLESLTVVVLRLSSCGTPSRPQHLLDAVKAPLCFSLFSSCSCQLLKSPVGNTHQVLPRAPLSQSTLHLAEPTSICSTLSIQRSGG
jgi:hypothetical protein